LVPTIFEAGIDPLFVTVFFGANDASLPGDREHNQHVPVDEYEQNLRTIVTDIVKLRKHRTTPIILMTPPPLDEQAWDKYCRDEHGDLSPRSNESSKLYGERVKLVAKETGCCLVDSFSFLGVNDGASTYGQSLEDGLHLSARGNQLLFNGLMEVISRDLPHLAPKVSEENGRDFFARSSMERTVLKNMLDLDTQKSLYELSLFTTLSSPNLQIHERYFCWMLQQLQQHPTLSLQLSPLQLVQHDKVLSYS
jgi:lysophospholipase L1-like esterase